MGECLAEERSFVPVLVAAPRLQDTAQTALRDPYVNVNQPIGQPDHRHELALPASAPAIP
jgi:hypothetical protein